MVTDGHCMLVHAGVFSLKWNVDQEDSWEIFWPQVGCADGLCPTAKYDLSVLKVPSCKPEKQKCFQVGRSATKGPKAATFACQPSAQSTTSDLSRSSTGTRRAV